MTKPGDSQTKKTLHELAKEFPDKTYRELEKYRDADRQEEALGIGGIGHNQPPDLVEVMAIENDKLKKRVQEAEGELTIIKGIGNTSPEMKLLQQEVAALKTQLHTDRAEYQKELDRIKKENNECYNRIADLTESLKSKDYFKDPDYKFLVEENLNLRRRITELEQEVLETKADNIKLAKEVEDRIDKMRKSGM
jgi:cell division protein FtsB